MKNVHSAFYCVNSKIIFKNAPVGNVAIIILKELNKFQVLLARTPPAVVTVQAADSGEKAEGGAAAAVVVSAEEEQSGDVSPLDDASDLATVNEDEDDRITNDNNILLDPDILTDQVKGR